MEGSRARAPSKSSSSPGSKLPSIWSTCHECPSFSREASGQPASPGHVSSTPTPPPAAPGDCLKADQVHRGSPASSELAKAWLKYTACPWEDTKLRAYQRPWENHPTSTEPAISPCLLQELEIGGLILTSKSSLSWAEVN